MEEAFPPAETWPYEKAKELIAEPDYRILCVKSKKEKLAGFLAIRDFPPTFNFAEYFAIRKSMRGGRGGGLSRTTALFGSKYKTPPSARG